MKNKFNVIIENISRNGFEEYDILPYLSSEWKELKPATKKEVLLDLQKWVDRVLRYQYWGRCEYEIQLLPWPDHPEDTPKKIDIYWQASMNLPLITKLFAENEGITL